MVSEWGLVCDHKWAPSVIFTVQMVGVLLGAYIAGHLGDSVGRRACLYGMVGLHGIANLIAVFSPSWQVFTVFRFFIGVAVGGILTTSFIVPMEFTGQFWRGIVGSLPTWNIGAALFSVAVIVLKDWRKLHVLSGIVSGLAFLAVFWVPESLRWLTVHGRDVKAGAVATKIARLNQRPLPSLELLAEMAESERQRAIIERSERYTYIDLIRGSTIRNKTIIMGFIWVSMAFVYYGISFGVPNLSGDFYINFLILSLMEVPAMLFVLPTLSFLSRRWGSAILFSCVFLACFGVTVVTLALGCDLCDQSMEKGNVLKEKLTMGLAVIAKVGTIGGVECHNNILRRAFPNGSAQFVLRLSKRPGPNRRHARACFIPARSRPASLGNGWHGAGYCGMCRTRSAPARDERRASGGHATPGEDSRSRSTLWRRRTSCQCTIRRDNCRHGIGTE